MWSEVCGVCVVCRLCGVWYGVVWSVERVVYGLCGMCGVWIVWCVICGVDYVVCRVCGAPCEARAAQHCQLGDSFLPSDANMLASSQNKPEAMLISSSASLQGIWRHLRDPEQSGSPRSRAQ